jgi:hypothetical protein
VGEISGAAVGSFAPNGVLPPKQGWKVYVSATLANAEHVLSVVAEHCLRSGLAFKFLRSRWTDECDA